MTWLQAAAEGQPNPIIPNGLEFIVALVFFGILFALVWKFVVPAFEKSYAARTEAIEGGIHQAEIAQEKANAALAEYQGQLADARGEANRIRENAREQAAQIVADARAQAQQEAARIVVNAEAQIAAERSSAESSLRNEVGSLASTLAGRIVGESLDDDDRSRRVIDRFLAELEATPTASTSGSATLAGSDGGSSGASAYQPAPDRQPDPEA